MTDGDTRLVALHHRSPKRREQLFEGHMVDENAEPGLIGHRRALAIGCVLAALVLVVLDAVIVNVALPAIAHSLRISPAESVWVVTAYQLALVMTLLPCAALGESFGYRRVYTASVGLFVFGSALCALAPSLWVLVVARFIQGLGGAAIMALGIALLRLIVSERQLGAAISWNTLAVALSSAAGPALGALVLSSANWRWLFAINLPLGALVLLGTRARLVRQSACRHVAAPRSSCGPCASASQKCAHALNPYVTVATTVARPLHSHSNEENYGYSTHHLGRHGFQS